MESPVLQNSIEVQKKSKKKLYLAFATALIILTLGFLLIIIFLNSRPVEKSQENTTTDQNNNTVSAPDIAVGEPDPNTPIPVESELTYTFPAAHGFEVTYTAADWTVTQEPTQVNNYDPNTSQSNNNDLRLESTTNPNNNVTFFFTKANSSMISGNPTVVCSDQYTILIDQGPIGSDGGDINKGLIRMIVPGGNSIYAKFYYQNSSEPTKMCIYDSHPIYFKEKIAGGDNGPTPDTNDIYWIVKVSASKDNTELASIDEMVKTITFAQ